jgi:hypothetical protein
MITINCSNIPSSELKEIIFIIEIVNKDYSFITEDNLESVYKYLSKLLDTSYITSNFKLEFSYGPILGTGNELFLQVTVLPKDKLSMNRVVVLSIKGEL